MTQIDFTVSSTADAVDVRWGWEHPFQTAHIKLHPNNTRASRAPSILMFHGGGAQSYDARLPFITDAAGNFIAARAMDTSPDGLNFNIVSMNLPQYEYSLGDATYPYALVDTVGNAHTQTAASLNTPFWGLPSTTMRMTWPGLFELTKLAIIWWKSVCEQYGSDPARVIIAGFSFGGQRAMVSQMGNTLHSDTLLEGRGGFSLSGVKSGVDSTVRGIINHQGTPDIRRGPDYLVAAGGAATAYPISANVVGRYLGARIKSLLDAMPERIFQELSLLHWLENPDERVGAPLLPMYHIWERNGVSGNGTAGTLAYPLTDVHGEQQLFNVEEAYANAGVTASARFALPNPTDILDDADVDPRDAEGRTYQEVQADDILEWAAEVVTGGKLPRSGHGPLYWGEADYE